MLLTNDKKLIAKIINAIKTTIVIGNKEGLQFTRKKLYEIFKED